MFRRTQGRLLHVGAQVAKTIQAYRQLRCWNKEAGGVLIGQTWSVRPRTVIDSVTTPSRADIRSRYRFVRAREPAQTIIINAWKASEGHQNYVGEWHTHPEDDPQPSPVDLDNWRMLAREAMHEQEALFFLIAGRIVLSAWEIERGGDVVPLVAIRTP